ncbi:MAG: TonB family protein [Acidobacteriota bacterium]
MKMLLRCLVAILLINLASYSQAVQNTTPAVWERYMISEQGVSFMFPKMPVRDNETNICNEFRSSKYYSYAEGVVYEFGVYEKLPKSAGYKCYETLTPFSRSTMVKRLDEVAKSDTEVLGSRTKIDGREANRFVAAEWTRLLINDVDKHERWVELAVHHYAGDAPNFDRFLKSIEFSAKSGKEIGAGIDSVLADPMPKVRTPTQETGKDPTKVKSGSGNGSGPGFGVRGVGPSPASAVPVMADRYRTISQPKARYTDAARYANVEGPVRLKITLLASGGVGSVVTLTQLSHGLTENAIAAARRIVFLPKRVNGTPVSVIVTREYTFTIY